MSVDLISGLTTLGIIIVLCVIVGLAKKGLHDIHTTRSNNPKIVTEIKILSKHIRETTKPSVRAIPIGGTVMAMPSRRNHTAFDVTAQLDDKRIIAVDDRALYDKVEVDEIYFVTIKNWDVGSNGVLAGDITLNC